MSPHLERCITTVCWFCHLRPQGDEFPFQKNNKNLYYCCKSNQKEHRGAYQMALIFPGAQGKYISRCSLSILLPALLRKDNQQPDSSTRLIAQLCPHSLFWKQCVMNSSGIIWHARALGLLSAADCLLPLQQLEELAWKNEATIAFH